MVPGANTSVNTFDGNGIVYGADLTANRAKADYIIGGSYALGFGPSRTPYAEVAPFMLRSDHNLARMTGVSPAIPYSQRKDSIPNIHPALAGTNASNGNAYYN